MPATSTNGLGDYTERVLSAFGITKERYCEVKAMFGRCPECWCDERREWLNRVSEWLRKQPPQQLP